MKKRAAMELSVGTIVVIVLAMSMLIFGLILIRNIFSGGTDAITAINQGVTNEISKMFSDPNQKVAIMPQTRRITLKQGSRGAGIALSIKNVENNDNDFTYTIGVDQTFDSETRCNGFTKEEINSWLDLDSGAISLGRGETLSQPDLISFTLPELAPLCNIPFRVQVNYARGIYTTSSFWVNIE